MPGRRGAGRDTARPRKGGPCEQAQRQPLRASVDAQLQPLVFPQLGLGAGLSLLFASLVAGGLALALRKVFGSPRARRRSADGGFRIPKALKVASVIGVLWIVLYLVLIARGGN